MLCYFYLFYVLLCTNVCKSQLLQVTLTHRGVSSVQTGEKEGLNLELICQVENLNGRIVEWLKGSMLIASNPEKYQLTANDTTGIFSLTILNLTRNEDSDTYYCSVFGSQADVPVSHIERDGISVDVYYFPDPGNPVCSGQAVIQEGISQTFRCQTQPGEPKVVPEWRRDVGIVDTDNINTPNQLVNGLEISEYTFIPSRNDAGDNVTCKISSTAFSDISTCSIGPLVVNYGPNDVAITEGSHFSDNMTYDALMCSATAFPPDLSYGWIFSSSLNSSQVMVLDDNQTLVILDVISCETQITATCKATNQIGSSVADFVLCQPPTTTSAPTTTKTTTTHSSTSLEDSTESEPAGSQFPTGSEPPTTTDESAANPVSKTLTPAIYAVIAGGAVILLLLVIGLTYIAVTRRDDGIDTEHEDIEKIYENRNVRALSIAYNEDEGINAAVNNAYETETGFQDSDPANFKEPVESNGNLKNFLNVETSLTSDQNDIDNLEEAGRPEESAPSHSSDKDDVEADEQDEKASSHSSDKDDVEEDDEQDESGSSQSSDNGNKASDNPSLGPEDTDMPLDTPKSDDNGNDSDEESNDDEHEDDTAISSDEDNENQEVEDEKMVDPIREEEPANYEQENRKSLVQEALLAVNLPNPSDNTARGGFKVASEMDL